MSESVAAGRFFPVLRVAVAAQAVAIMAQAVTAGLLLSTSGGRSAHALTAVIVTVTALGQLMAAILVWRPGGGPGRFFVGTRRSIMLAWW
ncbi:hypothetical protein ACFLIM_14695 [Nonomuraea sp. M3C6]|uniref:Uncharacterized protein n=1 Tax=Nonomuraea marmarensis TaxID=3351344 RepID=A0ABW7AAQ5_9ACTN